MISKNPARFQGVQNKKLGAQISRQLVEAIASGQYKPGDQLPPERELAMMFETSRVAVRDALGALIAKGILNSRQGSGTTVNPVENWNTLDPEILMLRDGDSTFDQLQEVRRIIEPELCALAAERITDEEIEALRALSDLSLTDTVDQHVERDTDFHLMIARITKNTVLQIVLSSISDLLKAGRRRSFLVPGELAAAREWHQKIFSAIANHDVEGARRAMVEHMAQVQRSLEGYKTVTHHDERQQEEL